MTGKGNLFVRLVLAAEKPTTPLINEPKPTFACLMNEHGKRVSEFPSQSETLKL